MSGPIPKEQRRRRNKPARGDWRARSSLGWQHGEIPPAPEGVMPATQAAWSAWMQAWFAAHWTPADLPGLRQVARLFDQLERGEFTRAAELRMGMDNYGITPKGQAFLRWAPPKADAPEMAPAPEDDEDEKLYGHLRRVV